MKNEHCRYCWKVVLRSTMSSAMPEGLMSPTSSNLSLISQFWEGHYPLISIDIHCFSWSPILFWASHQWRTALMCAAQGGHLEVAWGTQVTQEWETIIIIELSSHNASKVRFLGSFCVQFMFAHSGRDRCFEAQVAISLQKILSIFGVFTSDLNLWEVLHLDGVFVSGHFWKWKGWAAPHPEPRWRPF